MYLSGLVLIPFVTLMFFKVAFSYTDVLFSRLKSNWKSLRLIRDLSPLLTKDAI